MATLHTRGVGGRGLITPCPRFVGCRCGDVEGEREGTASGRFLHRRSPLGTAVFKGWTRKSNVACFKRPVPQKFSTVEKEPCKFPPAKFTSLFRRPSFSTVYQVFFFFFFFQGRIRTVSDRVSPTARHVVQR